MPEELARCPPERSSSPNVFRAGVAALGCALIISACGRSLQNPSEVVCASAPRPVPQVEVRTRSDAPSVALVTREGDPEGAVALLVLTEAGAQVSAALAAVVEARLLQSAIAAVDSRADRDVFRVRALLASAAQAPALISAMRTALSTPIAAQAPELGLASRRLAALGRHPFAATALASMASCTGELGVLPDEPILNLQSAAGLAALERGRAGAYNAAALAFGAAGPATLGDAVARAVAAAPWPRAERPAIPAALAPETSDAVGLLSVFADPARTANTASVVLVLPSDRGESAVAAAVELAQQDAPLGPRLRTLPTPFRLSEVSGAARPLGGCVSVTLESERATRPVEEATALAIAVARQELGRAMVMASQRAAAAPSGLSPEASLAVRSAADPRDAAERAALWSVSRPRPSNRAPSPAAAVVGIAPSLLETQARAGEARTTAARLSERIDSLNCAWQSPVVEHRERLELGQAEVWVLLGSPCGTASEHENDAGWTALAITAAAAGARQDGGITVEPWISPDGMGVLAHGGRASGESGAAAAARIAERAAETLLARPILAPDLGPARALALARLPDDGPAAPALASALSPGHPSWLLPMGAADMVARTSRDAVLLRWEALTQSPLRVAVLANEALGQADAVTSSVDRWIARDKAGARTCPASEAPAPSRTGAILLTGSASYARALIGVPVSGQGVPDGAFSELTLAGLGGVDGWLEQALASVPLGARPEARLIGGDRAAALVIELRGSEPAVENGTAQVRALFARLRQGAMAAEDLTRSRALRDGWLLQASLDPRRRVVDLWRDRPQTAGSWSPDLRAWRSWAATALRDDQLVVVTVQPKR